MSGAWYNENDLPTAAWLRELIKAGLIADGEVDTRSIVDVQPGDVSGFTQCHFFAGIGGWSYALRLAGWSDDRAVWTGSCPCQPFSSAGRRDGGDDPRHLWPTWFRLIRECRPVALFGEQVEGAIAHGWLDAVFDDLEGTDYAAASVGLPAACVGAFHGRPRLWFVAHDNQAGRWRESSTRLRERRADAERDAQRDNIDGCGETRKLADSPDIGRYRRRASEASDGRDTAWVESQRLCHVGELDDSAGARCEWPVAWAEGKARHEARVCLSDAPSGISSWSGCDWIPCRDGKHRPVEPGTFPLADGLPARVGRLRGYGNAIVPQVAAEFISAYLEVNP